LRALVLTLALVFGTVLAVVGCSKSPEEPTTPSGGGSSINVTPKNQVVLTRGTLDFTATLSGTSDTTVTWQLLREPGVNDTVDVGTIVSTGARSAHFVAPNTVETPGFDLTITVQAIDVADSTVRGSTTVVVPRVKLLLVPGSVTSVPPGTQVPFAVNVQNALDTGFSLSVDGIPGGDQGVGTWVQTGATSTIYTAPSRDTLFIYSLLARSDSDPAIYGSALVIVRAGFPVPTSDPARNEYTPEWDPMAAKVAAVRGGGGWDLVVYDFVSHTEQVLTTISWDSNGYDGRIAWSEDGSRLAFSEESGGHRTIGLVNADGSGRSTFAPNPAIDYDDACFIPGAGPDSLFVAQHTVAGSSLRAYGTNAAPADTGRVLRLAPAGSTIRWPDAVQLPIITRPSVCFSEMNGGFSSVLSLNDNGNGVLSVAATGSITATQPRWAIPSDGVPWITYINSATQNVYRASRAGGSNQRVYTDFFPESGSDLKADPPSSFHFVDAHVVARLEPDGHTRLWVIGFPPSNVTPVSRALEAELMRAGVWRALSPADWRRWGSLGVAARRR
jgi:hypothetical protein